MVRKKEVIKLIDADTTTQDTLLNDIAGTSERTVFAEGLEVFDSQYYRAAQAGLKPEKKFLIWRREYRGETKLKHAGTTYSIIRVQGAKEKLTLTCEVDPADRPEEPVPAPEDEGE
jgi:hypothetical protein